MICFISILMSSACTALTSFHSLMLFLSLFYILETYWFKCQYITLLIISAAAAKLLQSCPTLCDPIDGSPLGSPVPGILQARTLEWVAISFSNAWKWKVKVKSLPNTYFSLINFPFYPYYFLFLIFYKFISSITSHSDFLSRLIFSHDCC